MEEDIIIVSLVRSNALVTLGFVTDRLRLNVAVTRATLGLLLGSDFTTLVQRASLWTWEAFFRMFMQSAKLMNGFGFEC